MVKQARTDLPFWSLFAVAVCCAVLPANSQEWSRALPGATYSFPADHLIHPDFKTEWWYFTGTLQGADGHEYGYELTFFRHGVLPPGLQAARHNLPSDSRSDFVRSDFKFAHFAVSDLSDRHFYFTQKINRGVNAEVGFGNPYGKAAGTDTQESTSIAWIEDWSLEPQPSGAWKITATAKTPTQMSIALELSPAKPPVIEGVEGVSQKAVGQGNASYYYSFTRLQTTGTLAVDGRKPDAVKGESWFDHEWASNQLDVEQVGWDWFCFQFDDRTELMLYAMRRRDGTVDPVSSGTFVNADGRIEHLKYGDFTAKPSRTWHSRQTNATYPLTWHITLPSHRIDFTSESKLDDQELVLPPISYWEGAVGAKGKRGSQPLIGHGYMELTGYAAALKGLQARPGEDDTRLRRSPR